MAAASCSTNMIGISSIRRVLQISGGAVTFLFRLLLFIILLINNVGPSSSLGLPVPRRPPTSTKKNESNYVGINMKIVHINSPGSPFYDPNATLLDRAIDLVRRSNLRAQYYWTARRDQTAQDLTIPIKSVFGNLLAVIDVGAPPVRSFPLLDTGSNLMWLQCRPCNNCYTQLPDIYDPIKSRGYTQIKCTDAQYCRPDGDVHCNYFNRENCSYAVRYGDKSLTSGDIGTESFRFYRTKVRNIVFGCGHENVGTFFKEMSGLMGLGTGVNSLLSQLQVTKLSFCFPRLFRVGPGMLRLGSTAIFSETMIQMYPKSLLGYDYLLPLESISVQGVGRLDFPPELFVPREDGSGGFMLDSGTYLTRLYAEAYKPLVDAVAQYVGDRYRRVYEHPTGYELCYEAPSWESFRNAVPDITFYFNGGGEFYWRDYATFLQVDKTTRCFPVVEATSPMAFLGAYQMQGYVVGLNLDTNQVSFTPAPVDCYNH